MNAKKQVIKIQLDYLQGPIWISDVETGEPLTGIEVVDNDSILKELNLRAGQLYSSYYKFDSANQACQFDCEQEKKDKDTMLFLIRKILDRLDEINDGSYVVEDMVTPRLRDL